MKRVTHQRIKANALRQMDKEISQPEGRMNPYNQSADSNRPNVQPQETVDKSNNIEELSNTFKSDFATRINNQLN